MRELKSMSPLAMETSSYLLLTFFPTFFFFLLCSIETATASCFFVHSGLVSSIASCLWGKVLEHHKISLPAASFSSVRVSECTCLCVCVCGMSQCSIVSEVLGEL